MDQALSAGTEVLSLYHQPTNQQPHRPSYSPLSTSLLVVQSECFFEDATTVTHIGFLTRHFWRHAPSRSWFGHRPTTGRLFSSPYAVPAVTTPFLHYWEDKGETGIATGAWEWYR